MIPPQSFRPYVVDLMESKEYPDRRLYPGGPPNPPYDATGYELSLQMGVRAVQVDSAFTAARRVFVLGEEMRGRVREHRGHREDHSLR